MTPKLSELPWDSTTGTEHRDAVLATSHAEPGPEQQPRSKTARKIETAAATAAAWVGVIFSKTANVTLGGATTFEENRLVPRRPLPSVAVARGDAAAARRGHLGPVVGESTRVHPEPEQNKPKKKPEPVKTEEPLVPWVKLQ